MDNIKNAEDRGSADAYYGRRFNPHYLVPNEFGGHVCEVVNEGTPEYEAYKNGYCNEHDRKDWGHD
jgi:hypothetical protein